MNAIILYKLLCTCSLVPVSKEAIGFFCSYSFQPTVDGSENDMRFIYCACCISYILNDWNGIDIPKVVQYIKESRVINYLSCIFTNTCYT